MIIYLLHWRSFIRFVALFWTKKYHTIRLIFLSFPEPSNLFYEKYNNCIVDPISRLLPFPVSIIKQIFPLFTVPSKISDFFITKYVVLMKIAWIEMTYLIFKYLFLFSFSFSGYNLANVEIKGYLSRKFFKYTFRIFIVFLIIHDWVICKCPYYEPIDNELTLFENSLRMTFVGPPFTDNENWTFHPIQTLFNISTYNNIYEPIVKRDYENIYNGFQFLFHFVIFLL